MGHSQRDCLEMDSFFSAGPGAEKADYNERIIVSGTEIDGCDIENLEIRVDYSARACKWFNRHLFGTLSCSYTSVRRFQARATCSLASFAYAYCYFLSLISWRYYTLTAMRWFYCCFLLIFISVLNCFFSSLTVTHCALSAIHLFFFFYYLSICKIAYWRC